MTCNLRVNCFNSCQEQKRKKNYEHFQHVTDNNYHQNPKCEETKTIPLGKWLITKLELHTTTTTGTIDWKLLRAPVLFRGIMDAYVPLMEEKGVQRGDKVISLRSNYLRLSCYETIPWKATRPNRQSISFTKKREIRFFISGRMEKKKKIDCIALKTWGHTVL